MKKNIVLIIVSCMLFSFNAVCFSDDNSYPIWEGNTAKQDLNSVIKAAKSFYPNSHLIRVEGTGDGGYGDKDGYRKIDGKIKPEKWNYWFRDPNKKENDIFFVSYNPFSGTYVASDNVILWGNIRGQDKGNIIPEWDVDSDEALKIAWDECASMRGKHFKIDRTEYEIVNTHLRNPRDLVFVWKMVFHYDRIKSPSGKKITPQKLVVYIDPRTGKILSYTPKSLEQP